MRRTTCELVSDPAAIRAAPPPRMRRATCERVSEPVVISRHRAARTPHASVEVVPDPVRLLDVRLLALLRRTERSRHA
jgi:hypothetical protein